MQVDRYVDMRVCGNSLRIALVFSVKQKARSLAKNKDGKEVLRLRRGEILVIWERGVMNILEKGEMYPVHFGSLEDSDREFRVR